VMDYKLRTRNTPSVIQIRESECWKLEWNCRRQSLFPELDGSSAETKMHFPCTKPKDKLPSTHKPTVWPNKPAYKYTPYSHALRFPLNPEWLLSFILCVLCAEKFCVHLASFPISETYIFHIIFEVTLTVLLSISLANDQIDAQIFNTFITILYMYMFRAISCSSSGGQIVLIQHLVSSLWKQVGCLKLL
jgi:hypothetical protein